MNDLWGYLIIEELVRNGIDYFVISPGSRSTPLTVAVARNDAAKNIICLDERGAAFHAIGYGRATGKPAVLICTSGSAAANYYPAAIEAATDNVPLIIISSDRPPELRQTGANQTINQVNFYGWYSKWEFDLPCPTAEINPAMVLTTIDLAVARSRTAPAGLVHLNCMFREPLAPQGKEVVIPNSLANWEVSKSPYTYYGESLTVLPDRELDRLVEIINRTKQGILVVGELKSPVDTQAVTALATRLNWVVFPDIRSGLRLKAKVPNVIPYFDQLLLTDRVDFFTDVDTVIQIGTRLTSARWLKWLDAHPSQHYIAIANDAERHDPSHLVTYRLQSDIASICQSLVTKIATKSDGINPQRQPPTLNSFIDNAIDEFLATETSLSEPAIARIISRLIHPNCGLWLANSMPIRDMDMYGVADSAVGQIGTNRGTSGIEGAIAAATGFAVGLQAPVTAIIGDLSSLHDLNSLLLLNTISQPVITVIINNDGGAIFSFLPIANTTDVFNTYFGTPHGLDFQQAVAMFKIDYYQPQSAEELMRDYQQAQARDRSAVIEIKSDRAKNWQLHQNLQKHICMSLSNSRSFSQHIQQSPELQKRLDRISSPLELMTIAKEEGFELMSEDIQEIAQTAYQQWLQNIDSPSQDFFDAAYRSPELNERLKQCNTPLEAIELANSYGFNLSAIDFQTAATIAAEIPGFSFEKLWFRKIGLL
jgi:2-succinyl-5-enolpyruvyl-6-hydroxy-3-cyclohexene-1-carboxylate synthase